MIQGVQIHPLRRIPDERGSIYHMLKRSDPHFIEFGEIYFSSVYQGVIKAWHSHREMTLNYACIVGRIKLVLFDDRAESPSRGAVQEIFLGPENYALVIVPPQVWNGFKGMAPESIVANCATIPHDANELTRLDPFSPQIPYDWAVRHG